MDKKITKKKFTAKRVTAVTITALLIGLISYQFIFSDRRLTLKIESDKITISEVRTGEFKEYIPQIGTVEPVHAVYLDAIEGGNIKSVRRESGAMVKKGDLILEISNLNREISILQQESELVQSINRSRDTRLSILRNDLEQRQTLAQIDNQLAILKPQYERQQILIQKKLIAKQDFERIEADYLYNVTRRKFTYEAYQRDSMGRIKALQDIDVSENRMKKNLVSVSVLLDNLNIRAPMDGLLSTAHWEPGQAITMGQRIGQIDALGAYKVRAPIDEVYLPKIAVGLPAAVDFDGKKYFLKITYIYPNVTAGQFEADMNFSDDIPPGIRRGQSLPLRIELGKASQELLLPMGGFYLDTGGNWVFVIDEKKKHATKREVKLGRKMGTEYFEVLEGLKSGDRVITSSYKNFGNNEILLLN